MEKHLAKTNFNYEDKKLSKVIKNFTKESNTPNAPESFVIDLLLKRYADTKLTEAAAFTLIKIFYQRDGINLAHVAVQLFINDIDSKILKALDKKVQDILSIKSDTFPSYLRKTNNK